MQETETAPDSPPKDGELGDPAAAQTDPGLTDPPPKGDDAGADGDQPPAEWWRDEGIATEDDLAGHDNLKPRLETVRQEGASEAQTRLQPIVEQGRKANRERLQAVQQTDQRIQELGREVTKIVREARGREEPAEGETLEKLEAYAAVFQTLAADAGHQGKWGGARSIILELSQELADPSLLSEFEARLENLRDGAETGHGWRGDLVKRITAKAREKWEAEERPKIEKQILARLEKEGRAWTRLGGKPPAKPQGGGGGRKRTVDELGQLTPEQIAALPDEELDEALTTQK